MTAPRYSVDLSSIERHMCPGFAVPERLARFCRWAESKAWGSVGCFRLEGDRFPDGYVQGGADLAPHFGFFMHLPEGSLLGFWRPKGNEKDPAIALLGSEGELVIAARSFDALLFGIALGAFPKNGPLDDLRRPEDVPDGRAALLKWLASRGVRKPARFTGSPLAAQTARYKAWLRAHGKMSARRQAKDPRVQALGALLRRHLPPRAELWESSGVEVVFGPRAVAIRKWPPYTASGSPRAPLNDEERTKLVALLQELREEDATRNPERGRAISILAQASTEDVTFVRSYLELPEETWHGFSRATLASSVRAEKRSAYWTPEWADTRPRARRR